MSASTYFRHHPNHVHDPAQHLHRRKLHSLGVRLVHLKNDIGKYKNLFNPNHRHDEPHEQRVDRRRDLIRDSHRYCSFADVRGGNDAKWYVDGRDYFWVCAIPRQRNSPALADQVINRPSRLRWRTPPRSSISPTGGCHPNSQVSSSTRPIPLAD